MKANISLGVVLFCQTKKIEEIIFWVTAFTFSLYVKSASYQMLESAQKNLTAYKDEIDSQSYYILFTITKQHPIVSTQNKTHEKEVRLQPLLYLFLPLWMLLLWLETNPIGNLFYDIGGIFQVYLQVSLLSMAPSSR